MTPADEHATHAFRIWRSMTKWEQKFFAQGFFFPFVQIKDAENEGYDGIKLCIELLAFADMEKERRA